VTDHDGPLGFLELEQIDRDIYRGRPGRWPSTRKTIYGGETAAQALRAAAFTVPEGRIPHSLHGYFLRPGDPTQPVIFKVDRDRDGRSFSARRVAALQRGEVIWDMACSFHVHEDGPEFVQPPRPGMRPPAESPRIAWEWCPILDILTPPRPDGGFSRPDSGNRMWTRVNVAMPDDPIIHACMHVFTSDVGAGFGDLDIDGVPPGGPSIDHALWLHHPARADGWVIWDCEPAKVGAHRGVYTGVAHDGDGNLVAMLAQEMLLRPPRQSTDRAPDPSPHPAATTGDIS
jgi:acyl-CoA thioesterase II